MSSAKDEHRLKKLANVRSLLWGLVGLATAIAVGLWTWQWLAEGLLPTAKEVARATSSADFELVDHNGQTVRDETFRGKWLLVFFGFTNCPDVCPTTLNKISLVMEALGKNSDQVQPLFVTVDPERDTPEAMSAYVAAFHPSIVGLTGTPAQVKAAAQVFMAYYAKAAQEDAPDGYLMDHSVFTYLIDPDGAFEKVFRRGDSAETIALGIQKFL